MPRPSGQLNTEAFDVFRSAAVDGQFAREGSQRVNKSLHIFSTRSRKSRLSKFYCLLHNILTICDYFAHIDISRIHILTIQSDHLHVHNKTINTFKIF